MRSTVTLVHLICPGERGPWMAALKSNQSYVCLNCALAMIIGNRKPQLPGQSTYNRRHYRSDHVGPVPTTSHLYKKSRITMKSHYAGFLCLRSNHEFQDMCRTTASVDTSLPVRTFSQASIASKYLTCNAIVPLGRGADNGMVFISTKR
jgi:hypothetical protein